jgi:hypothetical protein
LHDARRRNGRRFKWVLHFAPEKSTDFVALSVENREEGGKFGGLRERREKPWGTAAFWYLHSFIIFTTGSGKPGPQMQGKFYLEKKN